MNETEIKQGKILITKEEKVALDYGQYQGELQKINEMNISRLAKDLLIRKMDEEQRHLQEI